MTSRKRIAYVQGQELAAACLSIIENLAAVA